MTLLESNIEFAKQMSFGDNVSTFISKLKV